MIEALYKTAVAFYNQSSDDLKQTVNTLKFDKPKDYQQYIEKIKQLKVLHEQMAKLISIELDFLERQMVTYCK